jgi:hypothetical protein
MARASFKNFSREGGGDRHQEKGTQLQVGELEKRYFWGVGGGALTFGEASQHHGAGGTCPLQAFELKGALAMVGPLPHRPSV